MEEFDYLIIGAGFAGAVLAERLSSIGKKILIIDKREHIGGNCWDYEKKGIIIQKYGPHIFHTKNLKVFEYLKKFAKFNDYRHKVLSYFKGKYYPIPINLDTINLFYETDLKNEEEVNSFLKDKIIKIDKVNNSRDVVVSKVGLELYDAFIKGYTKKQWDRFPEELDKSVLERVGIRFDKDPYYFVGQIQGMPLGGFGKIFEKMLDNPNIKIILNKEFNEIKDQFKYKNLIYTGRIDEFFKYKYGKLDYRSINFEFEEIETESFQPNSVINYPEENVKLSRITEFKKFYDTKSKGTIICKETFVWSEDPAYPIMDKKNLDLLEKYKEETKNFKDVIFIGRLAEYKYYDMDKIIEKALEVFEKIKDEN